MCRQTGWIRHQRARHVRKDGCNDRMLAAGGRGKHGTVKELPARRCLQCGFARVQRRSCYDARIFRMIGAIARKLFGSSNERRIKSYLPRVAEINALESELEPLSDEELRARTETFKQQVAAGASLDDLLVPAFATCREAAKRTLGQRHFDVQLIGGMILHEGRIAEMKTGEGKTLVATLPVYLNALSGRGVHVVTVNDYLA